MRFTPEGLRAIAEFCLWLADQEDPPSGEAEAETEAEGESEEPPPPEAEAFEAEIPVRVWRAPDLPPEETEEIHNPGVPKFRPEIANPKRAARETDRPDLPIAFVKLPPDRLMTAKEMAKKTGLDGSSVWAYLSRIKIRPAQKDALGTNEYSTNAIIEISRQKIARAGQ
jgi:hypothetical protein